MDDVQLREILTKAGDFWPHENLASALLPGPLFLPHIGICVAKQAPREPMSLFRQSG
jgi:hypothetical protein